MNGIKCSYFKTLNKVQNFFEHLAACLSSGIAWKDVRGGLIGIKVPQRSFSGTLASSARRFLGCLGDQQKCKNAVTYTGYDELEYACRAAVCLPLSPAEAEQPTVKR